MHLNFDAVWQGLTPLQGPKFPGGFEVPQSQHRIAMFEGTWVAHLVKHLTLDFGSGRDVRAVRSSPWSGPVLTMESAWDSLFLSLCPHPLISHALTLPLEINR